MHSWGGGGGGGGGGEGGGISLLPPPPPPISLIFTYDHLATTIVLFCSLRVLLSSIRDRVLIAFFVSQK